jgi:ABC-type transporter Mla subunit MlaD
VAALNSLVEVARREAGVSKELMKSIEQSAATLKSLEASSRENLSQHLTQVNAALVKAFKDFGAQLDSAVENTIAKTDRHLSSGAGHLNTVVDELAKAALRMKRA